MKTVLFITDLHSGSRVPELAGVRDVCSQNGIHVEEVEVSRLVDPLGKVVEYWKPAGCILEGSIATRTTEPSPTLPRSP